METITHFGVKIPVDETILSPTLVQALMSGKYEQKEASELTRIIEPGERILEIGGGIGFISSIVARNANTEALRVIEANPNLIPFIHLTHKLNEVSKVEVENAVLMNTPGIESAEFYLRENFWASSLSPKPFGYKSVVTVPVRSFNAEVERFRPSMVICDIEGGELDLFMHANLSGVKKVYMEIHQRVLGRNGIKQLFDIFSARNFHYDQWHSSGSVILFSSVTR